MRSLLICISVYLLLIGDVLMAQSQVMLRDTETGTPVEGAVVTIRSSQNGNSQTRLSNSLGAVDIGLTAPLTFQISHVAYQSLEGRWQELPEAVDLKPLVMDLEDVVVTGQFAPTSAKRSVYQVRSLGRDRIEAQKANTIEEVLANELNIRFARDNATGRSSISLQGLSGQYVKVLLDGVPIVGRGGTSNDIDLNQIDIQTVERIEIVEGPMAVNYGADALAGVVNIITKKDADGSSLSVGLTLQEETVGSQFDLFDEGIHSPSLTVGYQLSDQWFMQGSARYYRFGGWQGTSQGRRNDWYPKDQLFGSYLARYTHGDFSIFYRLDYLDEQLRNLGAVNDNNPFLDPFAIDEEFLTSRWAHQLQADVDLGFADWNSVVSYTDFERTTHQFTTNLVTDSQRTTAADEQDTLSYEVLFTRQTLNNLLPGAYGSVQAGVEATYETAGGTTLNEGTKSLTDVAAFLSTEILLGSLNIRPGLRMSYNSIFQTQPTASINFRWKLDEQTSLRWSYGRGFRAPSIRELYHEFIDANHNIIGNEQLEPEYSHSINASMTHEFSKTSWEFEANGFYNSVDNMITFFVPEGSASQATTYTNLDRFRSAGGNASIRYKKGNLNAQVGMSYIGRYQQLAESEDVPEMIFSPEVNGRLNHTDILGTGIDGALFYKYTGRNKRYLLDANNEPQLRGIAGFHTLDLNLSRSIVPGLDVALGARNLLDVTFLANDSGGGVHGGGAQSPVAYGRSYFLQINYQFEK